MNTNLYIRRAMDDFSESEDEQDEDNLYADDGDDDDEEGAYEDSDSGGGSDEEALNEIRQWGDDLMGNEEDRRRYGVITVQYCILSVG
jgi:hypothetical protein